jgi:3-deoxy-manno-octulosonate cytidylyltransferase (CMP-KDO synthetase)
VNHTGHNPQNTAIAIIPARLRSTRLPGKPLLDIAGRPMVVRVVERALAARSVARAVVASDDALILETVRRFGYEAVMTRADHASGTDRLAEAAAGQAGDYEVVVNVQGDEPLISPRTIDLAVAALEDDPEAQVATTCEAVSDAADALSPDVVKVVTDARGRALYFSRAPVPYPRDAARRHGSLAAALREEPELLSLFEKHTGLYAYRRDFLLRYAGWPQGRLECAESLEQLRALERGAVIAVVRADEPSIGVDTEEDLERVRAIFEAEAKGQGPRSVKTAISY